MKNLIRLVATLFGAICGYGISRIVYYSLKAAGKNPDAFISTGLQSGISISCALLFGIILFILAPAIQRKGEELTDSIGSGLSKISGNTVAGASIGLILGLVVAFLVSQMFDIITNRFVHAVIVIVVYIIFGFIGFAIGYNKGGDLIANFGAGTTTLKKSEDKQKKKKQSNATPKVLDTSVIIDGRIAEILRTGFIEGTIIIPDFVLVELRHIADSADSLKRERGRHGLDILNAIRQEYGIDIYNTDSQKELKSIPEVDVKLLKLAEILKGQVVTNDYNLNKVAGVSGVPVLNINELANCLKPVVLPGEEMNVFLVKQGKERNQAIGYLNDGTMIVVEDGITKLGGNADIRVTSVLQTAAGRMIFGRLKA